MLLQILEDGRLTDSQGRTVDFKNTVIIMTSNVGARRIVDKQTAFGFKDGDSPENKNVNVRDLVMSELRQVFRPEFLNRVDDIIVFNKLTQGEIKEIAGKMLDTLAKRLDSLGIKISFTDKAVEKISDEGFDDTYGARPLRRAITSNIEDKLSERMLEADFDSSKPIVCDHDGENFTFNYAE
jgi:ATP-dependent Clp protease ATP-binding subunit ClpC